MFCTKGGPPDCLTIVLGIVRQSKEISQGGGDDSVNTDGEEGKLEIQEAGDGPPAEDDQKPADVTDNMLGTCTVPAGPPPGQGHFVVCRPGGSRGGQSGGYNVPQS